MRELRQFKSCDGLVIGTQQEVARHEVTVALPKRLTDKLTRMWAAEFGKPGAQDAEFISKMARLMAGNRHNARHLRDTLQLISEASCFLPFEETTA